MSGIRRNTDLRPMKLVRSPALRRQATEAANSPMDRNAARPPVPLMTSLRGLAEQQQLAWRAALQGEPDATLACLGDLVSACEAAIRQVREWAAVSQETERLTP